MQVSRANLHNISCLFGEFKVIASVSYYQDNSSDPIASRMAQCARELETAVDTIAPEVDGPAGIVLCGTPDEQKRMAAQWEKVKNAEWNKVPVFSSDPDCVAKGAAVLAAVSHGRLSTILPGGGKKPRAELGIRVQNVAPVALAVSLNYHHGAGGDDAWTEPKTLFDFDRQIPAGPHAIDCNAAECALHQSGQADGLSDEDFLKETKKNEGAKGIPLREKAALDFRVQVLQKWTRDGEWKKVGDPMEPLVKVVEDEDGKETRVACESVVLEISLAVTGLVTTALIGERYGRRMIFEGLCIVFVVPKRFVCSIFFN